MNDYHVHTNFSADSRAAMREQCVAAIAAGIVEIAFTEHEDYNAADPTSYFFRHPEYWAELSRCRAEFEGRLEILAGIEISEPHRHALEAQRVLNAHPWDFVLGSLHWVDGQHDTFKPEYFRGFPDWRDGFRTYFRELAQMARIGDFDILAHLDYPARYGRAVYGDAYDVSEFEPEIRAALGELIAHGKGIEINTGPIRRGLPTTNPPAQVVRWYHDMGGTLLTIGSDSHAPAHTGADLKLAMRIASEAGIHALTTFRRRAPVAAA